MFSVFIIISSAVCHCGLTHPLEYTVSKLKTGSNYGQKRPMIGWAHRSGQNRRGLQRKDEHAQPGIFVDIKQIVIAWSVVNIKISFVVQSASVSRSLSESQQHFVRLEDRYATNYQSPLETFQMGYLTRAPTSPVPAGVCLSRIKAQPRLTHQ